MTSSEIKDYIKVSLGFGVEDVELTDDALSICVAVALDWYSMMIGQTKCISLSISSGTTEYSVPADCDYVSDVVLDSQDSSLSWGFADIPVNIAPLLSTGKMYGGAFSDITQMLQYLELGRRTTGTDLDWHYDEANRKVVITPSGSGATSAKLYYITSDVDVTKIQRSEARLVKEYAYAHAMEILGNIRSKYSEVPDSAGGFTLNGELLSSNALTMKSDLTERLRMMQQPVGFISG